MIAVFPFMEGQFRLSKKSSKEDFFDTIKAIYDIIKVGIKSDRKA